MKGRGEKRGLNCQEREWEGGRKKEGDESGEKGWGEEGGRERERAQSKQREGGGGNLHRRWREIVG